MAYPMTTVIIMQATETTQAINATKAMKRMKTAAPVLLALVLGGCGGGGSGDPFRALSDSADPRVARLGELLGRADTLRMTGSHVRWSLSGGEEGGEEMIEDAYVEGVSCRGGRCVAADGTETAVRDLSGPGGIDPDGARATVGERGGFDTVTAGGAFGITETLPGLSLTVTPEVTSWGFWGEHGFAAVALGTGTLSVEIDGTAFSGNFSTAQAYAAGDAADTNPAGMGGATWTGIAEAVSTGTFRRFTGAATVTIADLSRPRVDVGIDLDDGGVDRPLRWTDLPLADGGFTGGTAGTDWIGGSFHGPGHEEAWGVFDTTSHIGAFGARRAP